MTLYMTFCCKCTVLLPPPSAGSHSSSGTPCIVVIGTISYDYVTSRKKQVILLIILMLQCLKNYDIPSLFNKEKDFVRYKNYLYQKIECKTKEKYVDNSTKKSNSPIINC